MLRKVWAVALAVAVVCAVAPAKAQLKFATVSPPGGPLNTRVLHPWAEKVNASGVESVQLDVRDGYTLGNFANIYDRVLNDVVQIASGLQGTVAGKFPLTNLISLPMLFDRPDLASVAFWRLYKSGALDSEYDEVVPLYVAALAQSGLHFARAPDSPMDLKGAKVLSTSKIVGESVEAIGGTPVSLQLTDMYPALQRRAVDAVVVAWTAFPPFKLGEVTNYHIDAALGSAPAFIFMSKKKFGALPAAGQKALMDASGEAQSRAYGAYWMQLDAEGRKDYEGKADHKIVVLNPAQTETYRARLQRVVDGWIASTPGSAKAVAEFKSLLAEVK